MTKCLPARIFSNLKPLFLRAVPNEKEPNLLAMKVYRFTCETLWVLFSARLVVHVRGSVFLAVYIGPSLPLLQLHLSRQSHTMESGRRDRSRSPRQMNLGADMEKIFVSHRSMNTQ